MKIKPKTKVLPPGARGTWGKYAKVWEATRTLGKGEYLPVECSNDKEARNLYIAAHTHRTHTFDVHRRDLTIYVAYKGERNGNA